MILDTQAQRDTGNQCSESSIHLSDAFWASHHRTLISKCSCLSSNGLRALSQSKMMTTSVVLSRRNLATEKMEPEGRLDSTTTNTQCV